MLSKEVYLTIFRDKVAITLIPLATYVSTDGAEHNQCMYECSRI